MIRAKDLLSEMRGIRSAHADNLNIEIKTEEERQIVERLATEELEAHLKKVEEDINNGNFERGRYHTKEISKSLIDALKHKLRILGEKDKDIEKYEERLKNLNDKMENGNN